MFENLSPESYKGRTGSGRMHTSRKGKFEADVIQAEIVPKKGDESKLNLMTEIAVKPTMPGDEASAGVKNRQWSPILGSYSSSAGRAGQSKILEVVDCLVACGVKPAQALKLVQATGKGITLSADDPDPKMIAELQKRLNDLLSKYAVGKTAAIDVTGLDDKPNRGVYNLQRMFVTPESLNEAKKTKAGIPWSPAEEAKIGKAASKGSAPSLDGKAALEAAETATGEEPDPALFELDPAS